MNESILFNIQQNIASDLLYFLIHLQKISISILNGIICPAYFSSLASHPYVDNRLED